MKKTILLCSMLIGLWGCELTAKSEPKDLTLEVLKGGFEVYGDQTKRAGFIYKADSMTYRWWQNSAEDVLIYNVHIGAGTWRKVSRDTLALVCESCIEPTDSIYIFQSGRYAEETAFFYNVQTYANDSITMNYRILRPFSNHFDSNLVLRGRYFGKAI